MGLRIEHLLHRLIKSPPALYQNHYLSMKRNFFLLQLTFVDEVGSQLEGLELGSGHVTGNGTEVHVSGSTGRQLAPGLLYIGPT